MSLQEVNKINRLIAGHREAIRKLEEDRGKLIMAQAIMIQSNGQKKYQELQARAAQEKVEIDHTDQCKRAQCEYCRVVRYCLQCEERLFCLKKTDCRACGRGGRPLNKLAACGFLLFTEYQGVACLVLIQEIWGKKKGKIGDIGGSFDPDKDHGLNDTLVREGFEESGLRFHGSQRLANFPYVELLDSQNRDPVYKMYLVRYDVQNFSSHIDPSAESKLIYVPINGVDPNWAIWNDFEGNQYQFTCRLGLALRQSVWMKIGQNRVQTGQSLLCCLQEKAKILEDNLRITQDLKKILKIGDSSSSSTSLSGD